jgi:threonine/homoserine/homoserine lactone efflux protein
MTLSGLLVFWTTYAIMVATPGPGVAAVVARALARGTAGLPAFIAGFVLGDLVLFGIAAAGFAVLAHSFEPLFLAIKWFGLAYLLFMAVRIWQTPITDSIETGATNPDSSFALFTTSFSLTLGNPKAILFFVAILPSVLNLEALSLSGFLVVTLVIAITISAILSVYALTASQARSFIASRSARRALARITAIILGVAAIMIAIR